MNKIIKYQKGIAILHKTKISRKLSILNQISISKNGILTIIDECQYAKKTKNLFYKSFII